jgi:hypothetical protein
VPTLRDGNLLRVSHALETLILIMQYVARKKFAERGLGVINVAAGGQVNADAFFSQLLNGCATVMANHDLPVALRRLAVRLLLVIATGRAFLQLLPWLLPIFLYHANATKDSLPNSYQNIHGGPDGV